MLKHYVKPGMTGWAQVHGLRGDTSISKRIRYDIEYIENIEKFEKAKYVIPVIAEKDGFVEELNAEKVGLISVSLGAGRVKKEDDIDKAVGIILNKKIADEVKIGDILGFIHANDEQKGKEAAEQLKDTYKISEMKVEKEKIILGIV